MVNSTLDTIAGNDGACTLREAIFAADTDSGSAIPGECIAGAGADTITFNIGGGGIQTIAVGAANLPEITTPITIDGTAQPPGGVPATAKRIEPNGTVAITLSIRRGRGAQTPVDVEVNVRQS